MGRYLEQYDKDYMRMAMLKQEEAFRHQVTELHRLYRAQKALMNDMKAAEKKRQMNSSNSRTELERWNWNYSCCQGKRRPCRGLDLELPAEEHVGEDDDGDVILLEVDEEEEEECGLELTLATGSKSRRRRKKKESSFTSDSGASFVLSSSTESGTRAKLINGSSEWGVVFHVPRDVNYQRESNNEEMMREETVSTQPAPWFFPNMMT